VEFIDLKTQLARIRTEVDQRIATVLNHGQFIMGPEIAEFESKLADFVGVKHCLTISSGTDALLIAMMALDIKPGDEVITTPFTFFATAETILLLGAKPVFVDIEPDSYNLDPNLLEAAITPKTRAIIPVSLYGQCANLTAINTIAEKHNLPVIEDAAQSLGAEHHGKRSGGLTTISCTSFFPSKPLGCYGDGGACFTNDDDLAERMARIRLHGQKGRYNHVELGVNGRMDTLQAAMMLPKLAIFEEEISLRQQHASLYNQLLTKHVKIPQVESYNLSVYAQYTIEVERREELQANLQAKGIPTTVHYPVPLDKQPMLAKENWGNFPISEQAAKKVLSLPFHPYLTEQQIQLVVSSIIKFYQ